jgi:hypothetical protein
MIELPVDFPHKPPENYTYEVEEFKRNVISIWLRDHRKYDYNNGKPVRTIWGFYNSKKREYYSPVNSKTVGKVVDVNDTRSYTSMPLNLNPLMSAFL